MSQITVSIKKLLEVGAHFGHTPRRWNPKMKSFIYGERAGVHIMDLRQTVPMFYKALEAIKQTVSSGGRVLFVGTKRQASPIVAEAAKNCGQYYVNHRWLGGMLTNWETVSLSIKRLNEMDEVLNDPSSGLTKKEILNLTRKRDKLDKAIGGIKEMGGSPNIIFLIDTNREDIAIREALKLNIPIVAIVDSNSDPDDITYPIAANDDSTKSIEYYCKLVSDAVLEGIQEEMIKSGVDLGEAENPVEEELSKTDDVAEIVAGDDVVNDNPPSDDAVEAKEESVKEEKAKDTKKEAKKEEKPKAKTAAKTKKKEESKDSSSKEEKPKKTTKKAAAKKDADEKKSD